MISLIEISDDATDADMEDAAFRTFAFLHPVEAYASYPDRFWLFFQKVSPETSRQEMEQLLAEESK